MTKEIKTQFNWKYNFREPDELKKFKDDVQLFILKQNLTDIRILKISRGFSAIIDSHSWENVKKHKWYAITNVGGVYAAANISGQRQYLQNYIWEIKTNRKTKHITFHNKLTLDCRFNNLLGTSRGAVMLNRRGKSGTTSKFKNVCLDPLSERWRVAVQVKGVRYTFGSYKNEVMAALVADEAAKKLTGKLAFQNFPSSVDKKEAYKIVKKYIDARKKRLQKKQKNSKEIIEKTRNLQT